MKIIRRCSQLSTLTLLAVSALSNTTTVYADDLIAGYSRDYQKLISQNDCGNNCNRSPRIWYDPNAYASSLGMPSNILSPSLADMIQTTVTGKLSNKQLLSSHKAVDNQGKSLHYVNSSDALRYAFCIPGSDTAFTKDAQSIIGSKCNTPFDKMYNQRKLKYTYYDKNGNLNVKAGNFGSSSSTPLNHSFNVQTLLTPVIYDSQDNPIQQISALDYIRYVSGTVIPIKMKDFVNNLYTGTDDDAKRDSLENEENQNYLIKLRSYTAAISAGVNSLLAIYNQRLPNISVKDLNLKIPGNRASYQDAGLMTVNTKDGRKTSARAMEEYIANYRLRNKNWRSSIEVAVPVTLQREMLYLASDQLYMSHQIKKSLERLEATMAAMQLSMQAQVREKLNSG